MPAAARVIAAAQLLILQMESWPPQLLTAFSKLVAVLVRSHQRSTVQLPIVVAPVQVHLRHTAARITIVAVGVPSRKQKQ